MKHLMLYLSLLLGGILTACGGDEYHYPSVKLEFLSATSGVDGLLQQVCTDEGEHYPVYEDASYLRTRPDTTVRIVSNYAYCAGADESVGVRLYATLPAIAPLPLSQEHFEGGVKTEPVSVKSIWLGYDYLNMVLTVNQRGKHAFHFVEEEATEPDAQGRRTIKLLLYHDIDKGSTEAYESRVYLSVPLQQYALTGVKKIGVDFALYTDAPHDDPYVTPAPTGKYLKTFSFEYIPHF